MEKSINIEEILAKAELLSSTYFKNPGMKKVSLEAFSSFAEDWYLITKTFGLNIHYLPCTFASNIECAIWKREKIPHYETLLQDTLKIACDDAGLYRGARNGNRDKIHYRMFYEMVSPLANLAGVDEATRGFPVEENETGNLVKRMRKCFENPISGIAMLTVIEQQALKIVESMQIIMKGNPAIASNVQDWAYIDLHLNIESSHADETTNLVEKCLKVFCDESEQKFLEEDIFLSAKLFADFWKAQSKLLFEE